jgi:hypothetical protein
MKVNESCVPSVDYCGIAARAGNEEENKKKNQPKTLHSEEPVTPKARLRFILLAHGKCLVLELPTAGGGNSLFSSTYTF